MKRVAGRDPTHSANNEIIKLAKSVNKCAASVAIARLDDRYPPARDSVNNISSGKPYRKIKPIMGQ